MICPAGHFSTGKKSLAVKMAKDMEEDDDGNKRFRNSFLQQNKCFLTK